MSLMLAGYDTLPRALWHNMNAHTSTYVKHTHIHSCLDVHIFTHADKYNIVASLYVLSLQY